MARIQANHQTSQQTDRLMSTVRQTVSEFKMIAPRDALLVGVSGGADSVALLHILVRLVPVYAVRLAVAHLNHGLRGTDADRDADFVASLAHRLALPFFGRREDTREYQKRFRLSPEEAGRRLRYRFFDSVCAEHGYKKIALGHHADDNAELVLMQLIRGGGLESLAGIPPVRDGIVIRPMIRLTKQQILDYCRTAGFAHVADKTNRDRRHLRNRVRRDLLPALRKDYNPSVVRSLNRLCEVVRDELRWTEDLFEARFQSAVTAEQGGRLQLSLGYLRSCPAALARRIIRKAIATVKGDLRHIGFVHTEAVRQLILSGTTGSRVHLPDRIQVQTAADELILTRHDVNLRSLSEPDAFQHRYHYRIAPLTTEPLIVTVSQARVQIIFSCVTTDIQGLPPGAGQQRANFDMDKLRFPMVLRNVRAGDRFVPLGAGGTQKVKKYFIDHKVPRHQRACCPVLVSDGQIIWVVGHRIAEPAKVTTATSRVLTATLQVV